VTAKTGGLRGRMYSDIAFKSEGCCLEVEKGKDRAWGKKGTLFCERDYCGDPIIFYAPFYLWELPYEGKEKEVQGTLRLGFPIPTSIQSVKSMCNLKEMDWGVEEQEPLKNCICDKGTRPDS